MPKFIILFLIKMALTLGLPWLESHVPPAVAAIIEAILKYITDHPDGQEAGLKKVQEHFDTLPKTFDLKRD